MRLRGMLGSPAWRRAPGIGLRQPSVLIAAVVAGLVLGSAVAAQPLYARSSANATVASQVAAQCRWQSGVTIPVAAAALASQRRRLVDLQRAEPGLATPVVTLALPGLSYPPSGLAAGGSAGDLRDSAILVARDGALGHVTLLTPRGRSGVWVPSMLAGTSHLRAGGRLFLSAGDGTTSVPIAGIYRDLSTQPAVPSNWWCSLATDIYYHPPIPEFVPPPLVLADPATLVAVATAVATAVGTPVVDGMGELGLRPSARNLGTVSALVTGLPAAARRAAIADPTLEPGVGSGLRSSLAFEQARAASMGSVVRAGTLPVWAASTAAGLALLAAAGAFWAQKRRRQIQLFDSQGIGAGAVGAKAVLELAAPTALGAAVGWVVARLAVGMLGPATAPGGAAEVRAAADTAVAVVVGLVLAGGVVALSVAARGGRGRPSSWIRGLGRVPFEVGLVALAVVLATRASVAQIDGGSPTRVVAPGGSVVLFPLLLVVGVVGLAARLARPVATAIRRIRWRRAPSLWLASRRLAHRPGLAVLLVAAGAVPVALLGYGAGVSASTGATLQAKGSVFVGSDVRVELPLPAPLPRSLSDRATEIVRLTDASAGQSPIDVIGVDPATFARGAYWDPSLDPGHSLPGLLALLRDAGPAAPAILAGPPVSGRLTSDAAGDPLRLRVVARTPAFPGLSTSLLVVDRSRLAGNPDAEDEVWARGSLSTVEAALHRAGVLTGVGVSRPNVLDTTGARATSWTVGYLSAAAWAFAVMSVAGLVLYVDSRQRSRGSGYVLARRMGLRRRTHLVALIVELAAPALVGVAVGSATSVVATRLIARHLDPYRDLPPAPLLRLPVVPLVVSAAVIVGAVLATSLAAQRTSDRAGPAEVLRDAG